MSEKRKYRTFTPEQKTEVVLAGLRGDRTVRDVCREAGIAETLYYQWRDRLLEGGKAALATSRDRGQGPDRAGTTRGEEADRSAGTVAWPQDLRSGGRGGTLAGLDVSVRVSRARAVVATGRRPSVVAKVAGISRQAIYRPSTRRPAAAGPGRVGPDDEAIVEVAKQNATDGTRMVAALASRELGRPVNRKRVQRVMRAHKLLQPTRGSGRRRRPGFFRVTRPDELWHIDMTKVWTAQHGWVYLHAMVDCCTREITGWNLELRCRDDEAIDAVEAAVLARGVRPGELTLGSDNGSPVHLPRLPQASVRAWDHAPAWRLPRPREPGVHRVLVRPVQEAVRVARRMGDHRPSPHRDRRLHRDYHHRPHSGLGYRTPREVAATWRGTDEDLQTRAT